MGGPAREAMAHDEDSDRSALTRAPGSGEGRFVTRGNRRGNHDPAGPSQPCSSRSSRCPLRRRPTPRSRGRRSGSQPPTTAPGGVISLYTREIGGNVYPALHDQRPDQLHARHADRVRLRRRRQRLHRLRPGRQLPVPGRRRRGHALDRQPARAQRASPRRSTAAAATTSCRTSARPPARSTAVTATTSCSDRAATTRCAAATATTRSTARTATTTCPAAPATTSCSATTSRRRAATSSTAGPASTASSTTTPSARAPSPSRSTTSPTTGARGRTTTSSASRRSRARRAPTSAATPPRRSSSARPVASSSVSGGGGNDDDHDAQRLRRRRRRGRATTAWWAGFDNDTITGGPGRDAIFADATGSFCGIFSCTVPFGNDTVNARDGEADSIDCGIGADRAVVDTIDTVANCETVEAGRGRRRWRRRRGRPGGGGGAG